MPYIILIVILLLLTIVILNRSSNRPCQWMKKDAPRGSMQEYFCDHCGASAYTNTGAPPKECKRGLRGGL